MKFQIIVNAAPHSLTARQALRYSEAVSDAGHELMQVFFFDAGVLNLLMDKEGTFDPIREHWLKCGAKEYVCCVNSVERYSVTTARDITITPNLHIAGMAQMISATAETDRSVTFGLQA